MNKVDDVKDPELIDVVEEEVKDLLKLYKYDPATTPIIRGSALNALNGTNDKIGKEAIMQLMDAVDKAIPEPKRLLDADFLMPIEGSMSITGRGTVVTGKIERGKIKVGDSVELIGIRPPVPTTVTGVEMFKKQLDSGLAGDQVGLLLRGLKREDVDRGQLVAKPGSLKTWNSFEAEVYVLTKEEGGRHTPFYNNYRPQFFFRTADITGTCKLKPGTEMIMPGDNTTMTIELIADTVLEVGMRFALREGGKTVGAGIVTKPLGSLGAKSGQAGVSAFARQKGDKPADGKTADAAGAAAGGKKPADAGKKAEGGDKKAGAAGKAAAGDKAKADKPKTEKPAAAAKPAAPAKK
jgi:elongation factor Tu